MNDLIEPCKKAPNFKLKDQNFKTHELKDYLGQKVILFFYPKDMTPGCTTEVCDFNSRLSSFDKKNIVILGVSADSEEKHAKFVKKHDLEFNLLADNTHKVCEKYGVWQEKKLYGKSFMGIVRTTYIIDEKGYVYKRYDKVKVKGHIESLLKELEI